LKFKIDENLPVEAATILRNAGFDAETIQDERLSGADDHVVAARVQSDRRILVTLDLDFSNIQAYPPEEFAGIMVLRLKTQDKPPSSPICEGPLQYYSSGAQSASCGSFSMIGCGSGRVPEFACHKL
jgi:predicted nuclease of predicted toxin-antitoxin system